LIYDTETKSSPSKVYGAHGTHCAGIAAAVRNNGIQVAGVAPDATLMSVSNALTGSTELESNLANGINWAWQHGADIISCSWWYSDKDIVKEAIDLALSRGREGRGCVFVKSAGNTSGPISFPGDYRPEVIAVANMKQDGTLSTTSAYATGRTCSLRLRALIFCQQYPEMQLHIWEEHSSHSARGRIGCLDT